MRVYIFVKGYSCTIRSRVSERAWCNSCTYLYIYCRYKRRPGTFLWWLRCIQKKARSAWVVQTRYRYFWNRMGTMDALQGFCMRIHDPPRIVLFSTSSARVLVIFFNRSGVTQHGESRYRAPKSTYCCSIFSYDPLRHAEWHFVCFEVMAAANRKFFNFEYSLYAISPGRTVEWRWVWLSDALPINGNHRTRCT